MTHTPITDSKSVASETTTDEQAPTVLAAVTDGRVKDQLPAMTIDMYRRSADD
ncbi:MAG TPA: hypothetical protein VGO98_01185 [Candidatus Saccharimonadales bacterium]|jgi:hypothetical protein|nr:hypothetical protein [Candidatus Saccharimonadales bacterium]